MTHRDPDDTYQLAQEELADYHDREAKRIVDAAREIDPNLTAAIDAARSAGHDDIRIVGILKIGNDLRKQGRVTL